MLHFFEKLIVAGLFAVLLYFVPDRFHEQTHTRFEKQIIILSIVLFALTHLVNFEIKLSYLPIYILLCSPQLIMGATFSYLRLNLGFSYAVAAHIIINSISALLETFFI